ncbi:hypothetical protein [Sulfitobacter sp. R18_1]|uniref:hypothetical protein n=1 Tax=Sulfitobacter sp. R18_1 TaxID=2821104 RepID=UPI001ADBE007|nr:hypothetical protein [Sulfitobacter sp. R18_1]MBO9428601.1 hypothetical protein [Sulfitobacter sp. R18_1]
MISQEDKAKGVQPAKRKRKGTSSGAAKKAIDVRVVNRPYEGKGSFARSGMLTFDSARPFWMTLPILLWGFLKLLFLPLIIIKAVVEAALSAAMLAIIVGIGAWGLGFVENNQAAEFLTTFGDRSLELARLMGLPY